MPERLQASIVAQGDEIVTGRTVDTNSPWLAARLADLGIPPVAIEAVGDDLPALRGAIRRALDRARVVVCTGGPGPTADDPAVEALAEALGLPLGEGPAVPGRPEARAAHRQARIPEGMEALPNRWGGAPVLRWSGEGREAWFLPGLPHEVRHLWRHQVEPRLARLAGRSPGRTLTVRRLGAAGAALQDRLPPPPGVPPGLEGDGGPVAAVVLDRLRAAGATLAVAESCTGGRIAARITAIPGASTVFVEGVCAYADEAKVRDCAVPPGLIEAHGAVSEPVARAMAEGIRRRTGATWSVASTGIAGPGGGRPGKPVGTVHLAASGPPGTVHRRLHLPGDREQVASWAAVLALDLLRRTLP